MNQYPLIKGKTDLKTRFPEVAAQWDDEKNEGTGPEDVQPASMKKVWWRCPKGHSWRAAVYARTAGNGCPYCAGNTLDRGVNDLLTVAPEIAGQWDAEKNGILGPQDVTAGNRRKAWWICPRGHSWEASVASRVSGYRHRRTTGTACSRTKNRRRSSLETRQARGVHYGVF